MRRFRQKKIEQVGKNKDSFGVCRHADFDGNECGILKYKFKLYKPVQRSDIYKITEYDKITFRHTLINRYGAVIVVNLHKDIEFIDGHALIGKEVVRKVKKSLSKK